MKRTFFLMCLFIAILALHANAQQNLFGGQEIKSADVNPDNSVTFRFIAPDAKKVDVNGEFAEKAEANPIGRMLGP